MAGKHVLMLLSNPFRPDPRVHKEARSLIKAGYSVTILCWDRDRKYPARETVDGIEIRRLGPRSSFESSRVFLKTIRGFWKAVRQEMASMEIDIIHAHDLDTLAPGVKEARRRRIPLVYDSHEIYHEMVSERFSGPVVALVKAYEKTMVRKPDAVIVVNERFRDIIRGWGGRNVTVVMGCPPEPDAPPELVGKIRTDISPDSKPVVQYIGVLEPNRNVLELVKGFTTDKCPGARLLLGGYGSLEKQAAASSGPRYKFIGPVKPGLMPAYTLATDIMVAVYDPAYGNNRDSVPNKLFEAMGASRPIIVAKGTWTGKTVKKLGCGIPVKYGSDEVFKAIDRLISDKELYDRLASNGRTAFEKEYNWQNMERRLIDLYQGLAASED